MCLEGVEEREGEREREREKREEERKLNRKWCNIVCNILTIRSCAQQLKCSPKDESSEDHDPVFIDESPQSKDKLTNTDKSAKDNCANPNAKHSV